MHFWSLLIAPPTELKQVALSIGRTGIKLKVIISRHFSDLTYLPRCHFGDYQNFQKTRFGSNKNLTALVKNPIVQLSIESPWSVRSQLRFYDCMIKKSIVFWLPQRCSLPLAEACPRFKNSLTTALQNATKQADGAILLFLLFFLNFLFDFCSLQGKSRLEK